MPVPFVTTQPAVLAPKDIVAVAGQSGNAFSAPVRFQTVPLGVTTLTHWLQSVAVVQAVMVTTPFGGMSVGETVRFTAANAAGAAIVSANKANSGAISFFIESHFSVPIYKLRGISNHWA